MNETRVTVHGNVVTDPVVRETRTGGVFTTFRIANTPVRRTADGKFVDGETSFYGVIAFNALGANVGTSVRKGQPVVVEGKLSTREWQGSEGQTRQSTEIDAEHVGHDLAWGRASFERLSRAAALGHDRLNAPEVAQALRAVADDDDRRPAGVDANGEVDPQVYRPQPVAEGTVAAPDTAPYGGPEAGGDDAEASSGEPSSLGDPETDDYVIGHPLSA